MKQRTLVLLIAFLLLTCLIASFVTYIQLKPPKKLEECTKSTICNKIFILVLIISIICDITFGIMLLIVFINELLDKCIIPTNILNFGTQEPLLEG